MLHAHQTPRPQPGSSPLVEFWVAAGPTCPDIDGPFLASHQTAAAPRPVSTRVAAGTRSARPDLSDAHAPGAMCNLPHSPCCYADDPRAAQRRAELHSALPSCTAPHPPYIWRCAKRAAVNVCNRTCTTVCSGPLHRHFQVRTQLLLRRRQAQQGARSIIVISSTRAMNS